MTDVETNLDALVDALEKDRKGKGLRKQAALEGGAALLALKDRVKHGDFLPMVEAKGITQRKANRWMAKAQAKTASGQRISEGTAEDRMGRAMSLAGYEKMKTGYDALLSMVGTMEDSDERRRAVAAMDEARACMAEWEADERERLERLAVAA